MVGALHASSSLDPSRASCEDARRVGEERLWELACVGLVRAVDRFDPSHGTSFTTFAVPTILGELRRHFRDRTWSVRVPRALRDAVQTLQAVAR